MQQTNYPVFLIHKSGDERENHKYVKREWKNGRWKYWYKNAADKLGFDERKALKEKEEVLDKQISKKDQSVSDRLDQYVRVQYNRDNKAVVDKYESLTKQTISDTRKVNNTQKEVEKLTEAYLNTPIGKIENAAKVGVNFVGKIFGINAVKAKIEEIKEQRDDEKDAKRREDIRKEEHTNYITRKSPQLRSQRSERYKAMESEKQKLKEQHDKDIEEARVKAKAQKIARNEAIEREKQRLEEEHYKRMEEVTKNRKKDEKESERRKVVVSPSGRRRSSTGGSGNRR